jgi:hypothetical protein
MLDCLHHNWQYRFRLIAALEGLNAQGLTSYLVGVGVIDSQVTRSMQTMAITGSGFYEHYFMVRHH